MQIIIPVEMIMSSVSYNKNRKIHLKERKIPNQRINNKKKLQKKKTEKCH